MKLFNKIKKTLCKRGLTSHEICIVEVYLDREIEIMKKLLNEKDDTWAIEHDIQCLKNAILYLNNELY